MRTSWTVVSSALVDGTAVLRDLAYAEPVGAAHLLDLYLPEDWPARIPLVIWSGGSAWFRDDGKGYAVAGVSVRSSAQAVFPAQLDDGQAALAWLRGHAGEHGVDPERVAFMGNSSGGWLAVMVGLTAAQPIRAVVDFYGPTDFLQMDAHMVDGCVQFRELLGVAGCHDDPGSPESRLLGGPIEAHREACARANPISYVTSAAPPLLILHGTDDPYVPHHQSELLYTALDAAGARATFYSIPGMGHEHPYTTDGARAAGYTAVSTAGGEQHPPPTWETIEAFLADALGG
jgi:acetyl esterase/lipase